MIAIDIIRKKRASGTTGGSTAGTGMATAAGGSTDRANEADHAQRADNATHADTAKELDGDSTVWATIRSWIANVGESVKDMFLRKDVDDETTHKLTMNAAEVKDALTVDGNGTVKKNLGVGGNSTVGGHVTTDDARSSDSGGKAAMSGQGWTLKNTTDAGDDYSILAVDDLIVRRKMEVAELEINKKTYVGGQLVVSDWGHKIWMLQPVQMKVDDNGAYLPGQYVPQAQGTEGMTKVTIVGDGTTADKEVTVEMMGDGGKFPDSAYFENVDAVKVWFCESDGTVSIKDDLTVGSMGMVQEFNVETGTTENATNTYYWGTCMEHGLETVRTDGKETKCIYAVFGVRGGIYALKSEAIAWHTFKAYASAANSTPPSAGDDMVGFGNADPYQDSARSDVVVIASKDADGFAPGLVSYRGIGRLRGGVVNGAGNYTKRSEQYSLPSTVDDERLDARISRNAGNVFKGSVYFTGSDGKTPLKAKYMLDVSPSAVQAGGTVKWKVMKYLNGQLSEVDMSWDTSENWTYWDVMVSGSGVGESVPVTDGSYTFASTCAGGYTLALGNGTGETADTTTVSVLKEQEIPETPDIPDQTVVWKLVPLVEVAEAGYTIDRDAYADYTGGSSDDEAKLAAVFKKTTNISLQYKVVKLYGDGMTEEFESSAGGNNINFTAYDKDDKQVGAIEGGMAFKSTDTDIAYVKVDLNYGESKTYDKRIVRVKLSNNGVMAATKDMLAYTYYGTDGETGISYVNRHLSTMEGNMTTVQKKVGELDEGYSTIKQTAKEISLKVSEKSVGRRNMLVGSACRKYGDGFTYMSGSETKYFDGYPLEQIEINSGIDGVNCIHCRTKRTGTDSYYSSGFSWNGISPQGNIKLEKGKNYVLSFYAKTPTPNDIYFIAEVLYQGSKIDTSRPAKYDGPTGYSTTFSVSEANKWELFTVKVSVPSNAKYEYEEINIFARSKRDYFVDGYICKPMLEEGEEYNGWTLSEQDYDYVGGNLLDGTGTLTKTGNVEVLDETTVNPDGYNNESASVVAKLPPTTLIGDFLQYSTKDMGLKVGEDCVLSFYARAASGYAHGKLQCYLYSPSTGIVMTESSHEKLDSSYNPADGSLHTNITPTTAWKRYWVHWRPMGNVPQHVLFRLSRPGTDQGSYDSSTSYNVGDVVLYGGTYYVCQKAGSGYEPGASSYWEATEFAIEIARPKLEVGATMTEWTEKRADMVDKRALFATGIDIDSKKITLTASNTTFRGNDGKELAVIDQDGLRATKIATTDNGGGHTEISGNTTVWYNKDGVTPGIKVFYDAAGVPHFQFCNSNGKVMYDFGPSGLQSFISSTQQAYSDECYLRDASSSVSTSGTKLSFDWLYVARNQSADKRFVWRKQIPTTEASSHYEIYDGCVFTKEYYNTANSVNWPKPAYLLPDGWYVEPNDGNLPMKIRPADDEGVLDPTQTVYYQTFYKYEGGKVSRTVRAYMKRTTSSQLVSKFTYAGSYDEI